MTKKLVLFVSIFCVIAFSNFKASATHIMGADLSFKCLPNDTIEFTLTIYRDCLGITPSASYPIIIESQSGCISPTSCTVFQIGAAIEVSPLCPSQISLSSCTVGIGGLPGVQQYKYSGKIQLPTDCPDYLFYWESCCRNDAITNIFDPGNTGTRVEATWNKILAGCDDSPAFSALPVPYICLNQLINYNHGGYDPDGDSLVYSMVMPLSSSTATQVFQYNAGFDQTYPLTTSTGNVNFNPATGQLTFTPVYNVPPILEITCLAIKIEEYRNDTLIGTVMRDIQMVVLDCSNESPVATAPVDTLIENMNGGTFTGINTIEVCPGSTLSLDVFGHDPDNNTLSMYSNASIVLPGGVSNYTSFLTDSGKIHITWTPTGTDTGNYVINIDMTDDACPVTGHSAYSFIINVPASTYAGPDVSLCWPDTQTQLIATGGAIFAWTPNLGLNDTSIYNPVATPATTTTYYVESDLSSVCKNKDTVIVFVLPALVLNPTASADTVCAGDQVHLFAGVSGGGGAGYNIDWSSVGTPFNSTQTNPFANPNIPTMYFLDVTSGACQQSDSVFVFARPLPNPNFNLSPVNLCPLTHATVNYSLNPAGLVNNWNFGTASIISGTGWGPYTVYWNSAGVKPVILQVTDNTGCTSIDTMFANVHPNPVADFDGIPVEGCAPIDVFFTNTSSGGDSLYLWNFGDGGPSNDENPDHVYGSAGDFDVTLIVTTNWGCKDTMTKTDFVHVIDHVVASFTTDAIAGQEYDLSEATFKFTNTSQYADSYIWLFGDGTTPVTETNPNHTYVNVGTYQVTLIAFNEYCSDTFTFEPIIINSWDDIVFPSGFTPNSDGHNDMFKELFKKGVITLHYTVYNRWGQKVFETSDPNGEWNGKFNNEDCEVGVYIWEATAMMLNGTQIFKKGNVSLLR